MHTFSKKFPSTEQHFIDSSDKKITYININILSFMLDNLAYLISQMHLSLYFLIPSSSSNMLNLDAILSSSSFFLQIMSSLSLLALIIAY